MLQSANRSLTSVNPKSPTGIVDAPKDKQYDVPSQMVKPLVFPENAKDEHDLRNVYNPNKKPNPYIVSPDFMHKVKNDSSNATSKAQINPASPTGLQEAPKDKDYDVGHQLKKSLIVENKKNEDDMRNVYNPNKLGNPSLYYQKKGPEAGVPVCTDTSKGVCSSGEAPLVTPTQQTPDVNYPN